MESELRFRGPPPGTRPLGPPAGADIPPLTKDGRPPGPPPFGLEPPPFAGPPGSLHDLPHSPTADKEFDPTNPTTSIYTNLGVWDYYTERQTKLNRVPMVKIYRRMTAGLNGAPYAWRLLKDVVELAPVLIVLYLASMGLNAVMPAVALYYSSRMFQVIKDAVETRSVDSSLLIQIAVARGVSAFVQRACTYGMQRLAPIIGLRVRAHFAEYILQAHARLDVPTFDDSEVRGLLETVASDRSGSWEALSESFSVLSVLLELFTQGIVLWGIVRESSDSVLLVVLSLIGPFATWWSRPVHRPEGAWFAKINNENYVRMQGLKRVATERAHRKELITGNLQEYISSEYHSAKATVGDDAQDFWEARRFLLTKKGGNPITLAMPLLQDLPQIIFALRAVHTPASIPLSLAQLELVQRNVGAFARQLENLSHMIEGVSYSFQSIQNLYSIIDIPNQIPDAPPGSEPLRIADDEKVKGLSIEFRNVSFKYPGTSKYVIKNMSFKIEPGQLCVIVGENGAAKSTSLKLILRLYEIDEGTILIDGRDVRNIPLKSLRQCAAVLFQDFSNFPLSIRENIAMGSPAHAHDEDRVQEAARLGGASEFIKSLPEEIDTYLSRPVRDLAGGLGAGQHTLLGRQFNSLAGRRGRGKAQDLEVSGGQQQRLALSRTFMRSNDEQVRLWMFDEPSASLDPLAEFSSCSFFTQADKGKPSLIADRFADLFERLRGMRGTNTMIFSTHRYGGLTRYADLILYLKDAQVAEMGTHDQLMANNGDYAQLYNVQAQAFRTDI